MARTTLPWLAAALLGAAAAAAGCAKKDDQATKANDARYRKCMGDVHRMSKEINRINREGGACARSLQQEKRKSALLMTRVRQLLQTATQMVDVQAKDADPAVREAARKIRAELQQKDQAFLERLKKL